MNLSKFDCHVLIIGSGMAGMTAALAALEQTTNVIIMSEGKLGKGSSTALSGGGFTMEANDFTVEDHCNHTLKTGHEINDPKLVQLLCQRAPKLRRWLKDRIRIDFINKKGGYRVSGGGAELLTNLAKVVSNSNARIIDRLTIINLLIQDGVCVGSYGILDDGTHVVIASSATVMTTGGFSSIYQQSDNPTGNVGDGIILAAKCGAYVKDLEFIQFYPLGLAESQLPNFILFRPFPPGTKLVNEDGEDVLEKELGKSDLNEALGSNRDLLTRIVYQENQRGQTYVDFRRAQFQEINQWRSLEFLRKHHFDFEQRRVKIAPIVHYSMGGIKINEGGETNVPRLYAAGEVTGGIHGANRLGGNALTDCLVFGYTAGRNAAKRSGLDINLDPYLGRESFMYTNFSEEGKYSPREVFQRLKSATWEKLGIIRNQESLSDFNQYLEVLREKLGHLRMKNPKELKKAIKLKNALLLAEMIAAFAKRRTESRGAHYRSDFPEKVEDWKHSQVCQLKGNGIKFME